jgi:non-heme Fe2+,alpha-ketoglutarate-dependent halogenase
VLALPTNGGDIAARYAEAGFAGPLFALDEAQNAAALRDFLDCEARYELTTGEYRCKSHTLFPWVDALTRNKFIGDAVEAVIGPDFHCWDTLFWVKPAHSDKLVSWHQDGTYWNLAPKGRAVSVWLCLSGATVEMGCVRYIPGSHKLGQLHHDDIRAPENLLMRGQTIAYASPLEASVAAEVPPGHFLIQHPHVIHGSFSNRSDKPRIACGMNFFATDCEPIARFAPESSVMIRGVDRFGHVRHDPAPSGHFERDRAIWKDALDRQHVNYYKLQAEV